MEIKFGWQDHCRQDRWSHPTWRGWVGRRGRGRWGGGIGEGGSLSLIGLYWDNIKEIDDITLSFPNHIKLTNGRKRILRSLKTNTSLILKNNQRTLWSDISNVPSDGTLHPLAREISSRRYWFSHSFQRRFSTSEYSWSYEAEQGRIHHQQ